MKQINTNAMSLTPLRRFLNLLKVDRQEILSIYVYALFNGAVTLSLPVGIQAIINLLSGGQVTTSWIVLVVFVIAGVAFTGILQIMQLSASENLQRKIFTRSAFEFAYRIPKLKLEGVDKAYIPELVNRFFDTLSIQKGLSKILMDFSSASLQVVLGLVLLSFYHPFFILFGLVLVIIIYLIFRFTAPKGLNTSLTESHFKYEVAHWLEEIARAMETFKLAGKLELPLAKTDEAVAGYLTARKAHFSTLLVQYINLVGFKVIIAAGLLIIGGLLVINQQMNIGQFVASEIIIILILASVEKLILSMETVYDVLTAIEKIGLVTDLPLESDIGQATSSDEDAGLSVSLHHLSYKFPDANTHNLKDIQLDVKKGDKLCLSGYEGSGKSLLLQIIAGLYEDHSGSITYNNIPLENWNKESLRSLIGDSLANEDIFKGSLLENISLGKHNTSIEKIQEAAQIVGLTDFVESLPDGYYTELVPEGKNLPKSTRLKIMLARCLTGHPKLILLEDNFNQLNPKDKKRFLDYVLGKAWTVIATSNDPAIAGQFDRVLVIQDGQVLANGNVQDLQKEEWYPLVFNAV